MINSKIKRQTACEYNSPLFLIASSYIKSFRLKRKTSGSATNIIAKTPMTGHDSRFGRKEGSDAQRARKTKEIIE